MARATCPYCQGIRSNEESDWGIFPEGMVKRVYYACGTELQLERRGNVWKGRWINRCSYVEPKDPTPPKPRFD